MTAPLSRLAALLLTTTLTLLTAAPAAATEPKWRWLLDRAAQTAEKRAYAGEVLWITYESGAPHVSRYQIQSSGDGAITVADADRYALLLGDDGGGLAEYERGWFAPLPAADLAKAHKGLSRLERKYAVRVTGSERLLDRPCTTLAIHRRSDGALIEKLWVDDDTGLLLRRETLDGHGRLLRLVAYLALDFDPLGPASSKTAGQRATRGQRPDMARRPQRVAAVDEQALTVLRAAGWTVPEALPGAYRLDGSFSVAAEGTQPLQAIYSDGLYTVSLFEQRGRPDLASFPPGAQRTDAYGFEAYAWPGAVPQRLVWEASGTTYSLVGDAPPQEFRAIAASLPRPEPDTIVDRIRRGLGRLWSWVSPWS